MFKKLRQLILEPAPLQKLAVRFIRRFQFGSYKQRVNLGALRGHPHYGYALYHGAELAKRLGYRRVSVLEFGVAGGRGLLALERLAREVEKELGLDVEVYGFDLGQGLPGPADYRDLPFYWQSGFFKMDFEKLKKKLSKAKLIIGDVRDTVKTFFSEHEPAPVAAVMFDLDYYSATKSALQIFEADQRYLLPRIFCYFDDLVGSEECLISEYTGQPLAVNEFNLEHEDRKIDRLHYLNIQKIPGPKFQRLKAFHYFNHPEYNTFIGPDNQQQLI